jgi:hypothetical protein
MEFLLKLFFLFSIIPFLMAEKLHDKYDLRINTQVVDTLFTSNKPIGIIDNKEIDEASGLAASRVHPGILYAHNDSGGKPYVYMIDTSGSYVGKIKLEGVNNRDWEDIAVGPGPDRGSSYIYVGEIGDNYSRHDQIYVYRFKEPDLLESNLSIVPDKITLEYPDGPQDAETLLVDPWTGDLFILSKRDSSNALYRAAVDKLEEEKVLLEKVMNLPITLSTGGDISGDGKQILIKNYWVIYYWERNEGESVVQALKRNPVLLPYNPEPQGEAIAFSADGQGYFTLSEKRLRVEPVLYRYDRLVPVSQN